MAHSLDVHTPLLTEARSLLLRGETAAARAILSDLVRRDPNCNEAIQMLLSLDRAQHQQKMAVINEGYDSELSIGLLSKKSAYDIRALLTGAFFVAAGLWSLFLFFKVGLHGEISRASAPTNFVQNGRDALLYGLGAMGIGACAFLYGLRQLRLK